MPSEPVSIAATSESMSPKRLSVTITSNCFGARTSCMPPASASMWSSSTSGYSRAWTVAHHLVPEHARLHDVALLHRGDLVPPRPRQLEGDARDALDLEGVVDLRIDGALLAVAEVADLLRLAEIDAAGQLAQDQDVEPLDQLALQRRGVGERRIADRRAEIGEDAELLPEPEQRRLGPMLVGDLVPFRPADRAEEHGVGGERLRHRRFGDRHAMRVDRRRRRPDPPRSRIRRCPASFMKAMTAFTSAMTSGPMPSPGRRRSLCAIFVRSP